MSDSKIYKYSKIAFSAAAGIVIPVAANVIAYTGNQNFPAYSSAAVSTVVMAVAMGWGVNKIFDLVVEQKKWSSFFHIVCAGAVMFSVGGLLQRYGVADYQKYVSQLSSNRTSNGARECVGAADTKQQSRAEPTNDDYPPGFSCVLKKGTLVSGLYCGRGTAPTSLTADGAQSIVVDKHQVAQDPKSGEDRVYLVVKVADPNRGDCSRYMRAVDMQDVCPK